MDHDVTFKLASGGSRGTFHLSQEGLDLIRCVLLKWIMQAEKGETAAREFAGGKADAFMAGQAAYFRNAASFLVARLTSHLTSRINVREQLVILTRWLDEGGVPPRWQPYITHADQTEADYGTFRPLIRGCGGDIDGHDGVTPVDSGSVGKVDTPEPPASPPRRDPAEDRGKTRPTPKRKGKGRARPDH